MKRSLWTRGLSLFICASLLFLCVSCARRAPQSASYAEPAKEYSDFSAAEFSEAAPQDEGSIDLPQTTIVPRLIEEALTQPFSSLPAETAATTLTIAAVQTTVMPTASAAAPASTAHVHAYRSEIVPPKCTESGFIRKTCACGDTQTEYNAAPLGHDFGAPVVTKEATCRENGVQTQTCTRCGLEKQEYIPLLTHQMSEYVVVKEATPTSKGLKTRKCTLCGMEESVDIPKVRPYVSMEAAQEMLRLVNEARAEAGVAPLTFNYTYYPCAEIRAHEIGVNYSHTRPNGKDCFSVLEEQGFKHVGSRGENIYNPHGDDVSPADGQAAFMKSQGHRENILDPAYTSAAICVLYTEDRSYFVQMFFS